jgi:hypothetical protein
MSDNGSKKTEYRPIFLNKGSYSSNGKSTIIKKYKVREGQNKGKVAHVTIKIKKNGEKSYSIKYEDYNSFKQGYL